MAIDALIAPVIGGNPNPNEVRVVDCLAWNLSKRTDPVFLPNGLLVDRRRDPRLALQSKPTEYLQKNALVRFKLGDCVREPKGSIGGGNTGHLRWKQTVFLTFVQSLTKDQDALGISPDQLKGWLRHDFAQCINSDPSLDTASTALAANYPGWGNHPSCIFLKIEKFVAGPIPNQSYPDIAQMAVVSFLFDESGSSLTAGYP